MSAMTTYLIEQRTERRRHDRMLVRIAQPARPSHRVLATVLAACAVTLAMMLAGCGDGLPVDDLSVPDMRGFSTCPDCSTDGGLTVSTKDGGMR